MKKSTTYIYGKHAFSEALEHTPDIFIKILFESGSDAKARFFNQAKKLPIQIGSYDHKHLPKGLSKDVLHQGVIAEIDPTLLMTSYEDFISDLHVTPKTGLLLLGEIKDPQNVGAMIRSAAAFGVSAVLIPSHNQAQLSGAVIKVSAGMAFRVPLVSIGNVNNTLKELKEKGFWTYGLAGESKQRLDQESFDAPTVLVVGNEGEGVRSKTKETCDIMLSIPMDPQCESLNAATSAAIALYQWRLKTRK